MVAGAGWCRCLIGRSANLQPRRVQERVTPSTRTITATVHGRSCRHAAKRSIPAGSCGGGRGLGSRSRGADDCGPRRSAACTASSEAVVGPFRELTGRSRCQGRRSGGRYPSGLRIKAHVNSRDRCSHTSRAALSPARARDGHGTIVHHVCSERARERCPH